MHAVRRGRMPMMITDAAVLFNVARLPEWIEVIFGRGSELNNSTTHFHPTKTDRCTQTYAHTNGLSYSLWEFYVF